MKTSETIGNLVSAFLKARAEIENPHKEKSGYGYKYASLDAIITQTIPILLANDLVVMQTLAASESGALALTTRLCHSSGEFMEDTFQPADSTLTGQAGKNPVQLMGASITYARRYAYCAMLCIAAEEDSDGVITPKSVAFDPKKANIKELTADYTVCPIGGDGVKGVKWSEMTTEALKKAYTSPNEQITEKHKQEIAKIAKGRKASK